MFYLGAGVVAQPLLYMHEALGLMLTIAKQSILFNGLCLYKQAMEYCQLYSLYLNYDS
jgi:hypothetical protein